MIARLDTRERLAVLVGGVFILLVLGWLLVLGPYFNAINNLDRQVEGQLRNLEQIESIRYQIDDLRRQLEVVESRQGSSRPLFSRVENLTVQTGIRDQLLSMRPQPDSVQEGFRQQLVELRLERITLSQLVRFLHTAEYNSGGIQVRSLRVRPRFDDRAQLDVNLVLMSLERV